MPRNINVSLFPVLDTGCKLWGTEMSNMDVTPWAVGLALPSVGGSVEVMMVVDAQKFPHNGAM